MDNRLNNQKGHPMRKITASRRLAAAFAVLVTGAVTLSGCSNADSPAGGTEDFSVTLDTAYGEILLEEQPERVVALSSQYADMLAALEIEPVAFAAGTNDPAEFPWLADLDTGEFEPELLTAEGIASIEQIADYEPDLILGNTWHMDESQYEQVSQIAPTYVGDVAGNPDWQDTMRAVGEMTGQTDAADEVVVEVDEHYAQVRAELPGLQGKTYNYVGFFFDEQEFPFGNGSWLDGFGLVPAENQQNEQTGTAISLENIEELGADVLAIFMQSGSESDLENDPRFAELPSAQNGTVIFLDFADALAVTAPGPHSLVWAMDAVLPTLSDSALNTAEN